MVASRTNNMKIDLCRLIIPISYEDYDMGISLVHEVGHWLGLLHVFQSETIPSDERDSNDDDYDPCDPTDNHLHGDYVDDTPFLPYPSVMLYNCSLTFYQGPSEEIPNTCPDLPGVDPVFNYMNYVGNDRCLPEGIGEFTCGQISRMYQQWMLYRQHNEKCGQDELKIDLLLKLDVNHTIHAEIGALYDVDEEDGRPVFDLARDMDTTFLVEPGNYTRSINFCVPNGEYVFAATDAGRNGFQDGFMELKVNGVPIHRLDGNFGSTDCIKFGSGGKLADLKSIPQTDFGAYRYDMSEGGTAVICSASGEMFEEPIDIVKDRFMRIKVFVKDEPFGICINQVTELYIGVDGKSHQMYPRENTEVVSFESEVLSCGEDCKYDACEIVGGLAAVRLWFTHFLPLQHGAWWSSIWPCLKIFLTPAIEMGTMTPHAVPGTFGKELSDYWWVHSRYGSSKQLT